MVRSETAENSACGTFSVVAMASVWPAGQMLGSSAC